MQAPPRTAMAAVTILGSGSWGTALGIHLARLGHQVTLWARTEEAAGRLAAAGESPSHPGVRFPERIGASADFVAACDTAEALVFACPSHAMRGVAERARALLRGQPLLVSTTKGIEQETSRTMSAVLEEPSGWTMASGCRRCRVRASPVRLRSGCRLP